MTEIPFVSRLGDALELAIVEAPRTTPHRRWSRPRTLVAALAVLLVAGTAVAAEVLDSPQRTTDGITCYATVPPINDAAVVVPPDTANTRRACAGALARHGYAVDGLVTCGHEGGVAVIPGRGESACVRAGLSPPPAHHLTARLRHLKRSLLELEAGARSVPPAELIARIRAFLDRRGFAGWRARREGGSGPCGAVAIDSRARQVRVRAGFAPAVSALLFGRDGAMGKIDRFGHSGCRTAGEVAAVGRKLMSQAGLEARAAVSRKPATVRIGDEGTGRYASGCAVVSGVAPGADADAVVLQVWQRD
jgi:hypothetical protein